MGSVTFKEFPDVQIPQWLLDLKFQDVAWHHDACPKVERNLLTWQEKGSEYNSVVNLVVWVNYEEQELREVPDRWQVVIEISAEGIDWMPAGVYNGDEEKEAQKAVANILAQIVGFKL